MLRLGSTLVASLALGATLHSQQPSSNAAAVVFEVASVKVGAPGDGRTAVSSSPSGLYSAVNMPLRLLIRHAFGLQLDQLLVGGPEWIESARYDISARAEISRPTTDHRRQMLQALLAERFKFSAHTEARELDVYALVTARSDGALGPRLRRSTVDCDELAARITRGEGPVPGLEGNFDLELEWDLQRSADANLPDIFAAVQEQLGLKLEPQRAPVDVVVIDRIERPSTD